MGRDATKNSTQYLFFQLNDCDYATRADRVKEIVKSVQITKVPLANRAVRGVTNIRGELIPVVDLSIRFGMGMTHFKRYSTLVIITLVNDQKQQDMDIAVLVDIVDEVVDTPPENIEAVPSFGLSIPARFVENLIRVDEYYVPVLNIESVLDLEELVDLEEAAV